MTAQTNNIADNFQRISEQIAQAAQSAGRDPGEVRLVVVTKGQPVEAVRAVVQAGARVLGENYPEETLPKMDALGALPGVAWHMIGHLQSRKSALVVERFDCLHSLDSLRLAERLDRQCAAQDRSLPVLLEFNTGGEESKFGWQAADDIERQAWLPEIEGIVALPHLRVEGLMTMPPLFDDPEQARPTFARLCRLRDALAKRFPQADWRALSMGTSADFSAAIQEGATYVRVGTAIMGPRPPRS